MCNVYTPLFYTHDSSYVTLMIVFQNESVCQSCGINTINIKTRQKQVKSFSSGSHKCNVPIREVRDFTTSVSRNASATAENHIRFLSREPKIEHRFCESQQFQIREFPNKKKQEMSSLVLSRQDLSSSCASCKRNFNKPKPLS